MMNTFRAATAPCDGVDNPQSNEVSVLQHSYSQNQSPFKLGQDSPVVNVQAAQSVASRECNP